MCVCVCVCVCVCLCCSYYLCWKLTRIQNLDKTMHITHCAYIPGKGMHLTILPVYLKSRTEKTLISCFANQSIRRKSLILNLFNLI